MPSFVRIRYVPLGCTVPTTSPWSLTCTLPRISSGQAILPKSGGFLLSLRCTQPPRPPPPAPPCALAPPAPEPPAPPPPPCLALAPRFCFCCELPGKKEPPDPRLKPPVEANALAWLVTSSSWWPYSWTTESRMARKVLFCWKVFGVGGIAVVVPMASRFIGGWLSRYVRIWDAGESGLSKTFLKKSAPELYECVESLQCAGSALMS